MVVLIGFAFISGIITILSPCILPVLPVVLSGSLSKSKSGPLGIVVGFVVSFTVFTLLLSTLVSLLGLDPDILRYVAVVVLVLFGITMLVPQLKERFTLLVSKVANRGSKAQIPGAEEPSGWKAFWNKFPVGVSLGIVWTPCVGPIMASVITLALSQSIDGGAVIITLAYTLGTSIPMLAIMFGGRALLQKNKWLTNHMSGIQRVFGVLMVVVGISIGFGWDRQFQAALLDAFPEYGTGLTALEDNEVVLEALNRRDADGINESVIMVDGEMTQFPGAANVILDPGRLNVLGMAPEINAEGPWFNSEPFDMESLKGKVVLVDFWTYSCINCVRTLPYLRDWHEKYADEGLVILGVHSPEFEFEKSPANVQKAMEDLNVTWPVVLDNNFRQWRSYRNRYWPAKYFIDAEGVVRYFHFGEGEYAESERLIQELLAEAGNRTAESIGTEFHQSYARSKETYIGARRAKGFVSSPELDEGIETHFMAPNSLEFGQWSLEGKWRIEDEYAAASDGSGILEISVDAKDVYLVLARPESWSEGTMGYLSLSLDGETPSDTEDSKDGIITVSENKMYHLISLPQAGSHILTIEADPGIEIYAFTFGG